MSVSMMLWHSSPSMMGRPSSPLNPHSSPQPGSSSPLTSPTPLFHQRPSVIPYLPLAFSITPNAHASTSQHRTRYTRRQSDPKRTPPPNADLFAEGTTPVEGAMWKEKFARRITDRERRKRAREQDLVKRRSGSAPVEEEMNEDEAERRAEEDDEEIFRRLMILQIRKAHHAQLVSLETETGGSDTLLPDFWEEDLAPFRPSDRNHTYSAEVCDGDELMDHGEGLPDETEEGRWASEAAEAEEAEVEAEEVELARQAEEAFRRGSSQKSKMSRQTGQKAMETEWDGSEDMEIE